MASAQSTVTPRRFVFDLQPIWRLLTSARFAVLYITTLAAIGLTGVLIPQIPEAMRGNPAAVNVWLDTKRDTFGPFTDLMYRIGLFNVFGQRWFAAALAFLVINVTVCTFNRWSPTLRNVFRPPKEVPDSFYERAHNRVLFAPIDAATAEPALRGLRFKTETRTRGDATYIFADKFGWAQLSTFVSHLALIVFIAGGLITTITGFTANIPGGEGTTTPVFAVKNPNQLQVRVDDAIGTFGAEGNPLDFRTHLTIFHNGEEVKSGFTTVNNPLKYHGYRFHQSGYFPFGAALRIRETSTGNTVFAETFPLQDVTAAPAITVTDATGATLLKDVIVPTDFLPSANGTIVTVPGTDKVLWVGIAPLDKEHWQLIAYDAATGSQGSEVRIAQGAGAGIGALHVSFDEVRSVPTTVARSVPGFDGDVVTEMHDAPGGGKLLTLVSKSGLPMTLAPNEPVEVGGFSYVFEGSREFAGIAVKKDSGAWFIWVATALLLGGLAVTFYVPRRRLWLKLTPTETRIAALAEKSGGFEKDMRTLARRLGVPIPREIEEEA